MRRLLIALAVAFIAVIGADRAGFAARSPDYELPPAGDRLELVVYEVEDCNYCAQFRRDILPAYLLSPRAAEVPIRFIDLADGRGGVKLSSPIEVVPTAVLTRNSQEAGRITGYAGRESFFQLVRFLLSRQDY